MPNEPILSAATRVQLARASLADARRLLRDAQDWGAGYGPKCDALARRKHAEARALIASARTMYAEAMRECAKRGGLTHHYARVPGNRYRAAVHVPGGATAWASITTYGQRQSAQRAAANHIGRLARQGV